MGEENLVRRWLRGWVASRGWISTEVEDGIWSVPVEQPGRAVEYVLVDADNNPSQVIRAAALAASENSWVAVATGNREKCARAEAHRRRGLGGAVMTALVGRP